MTGSARDSRRCSRTEPPRPNARRMRWRWARPSPRSRRNSQREATVVQPKDLDPAATDKAKSFQEAMHNGDAGTVAFLLNSGYRPTRVELRNALLQVKSTQAVQVATAAVASDIHEIACGFT